MNARGMQIITSRMTDIMISAAYFSIRRKVLSIALFAVDMLARLRMAPESTPLKLAGLTSNVPGYYEPNRERYHEEVFFKNDERREEGVRERDDVRHSGRKFGREREEIEQTHEGRVGPPIQDILQYIII